VRLSPNSLHSHQGSFAMSAKDDRIHPLHKIASRLAALIMLATSFAGLTTHAANAQNDGWAPPTAVYVATTGHVVDKTFLSTWRSYQYLIGSPVTSEQSGRVRLPGVPTKTRTIQYFENVALAATYDDERGDDWNVVALSLGQDQLTSDTTKLKKEKLPDSGTCDGMSSEGCSFFKSTGHTVKLGFKSYWDANMGAQLIGSPLTEEFVARNGWTTQYFERAVLRWKDDEGIVPLELGTLAAKREKLSTKSVSQPDDVPTYDESLFYEPVVATLPEGPGPIQGGYKEVVVSISQEYMWAYEDDVLVMQSYVSTGTAETPEVTTPTGYFSVLTKFPSQTMEGTISGQYYRVPDVPYVMYFDNLGDALHGTYWHNNFGHPMSHGCVNLPMDVAAWMYDWAPVGTPVTVIS